MEWIAAQPWSDGNIAMYGDSQQAMVQFAAAAAGNLHLKAILPAASQVDIYQSVEYPGGVFNKAFDALVKSTIPLLDRLATPVDSDPDGVLLAQARDSRRDTFTANNVIAQAANYAFHDSVTTEGISTWKTMDLYQFIPRINQTHIAIYMTVGWYDIFTADMFYWYDNLTLPKRLTVRPTDHSQVSANLSDLNYGTEALRWLDYWLKGIDNGVMAEPPIHYYLQNGTKKGIWQSSTQWPLASQKLTAYYFGQGRSSSSASVNDGSLVRTASAENCASDDYIVDYSTTTGTKTRWGAVEEAHVYPDLSDHDSKALTYTTPPLESDVVLTGHAVVHLWLTTTAPDLDAFVYLEQVGRDGKSTYVTEGDLRASHRRLRQAPYSNFGLPYQTHDEADQESVPAGEPFELTFSLLPTSYRFPAGSRIRITVAFADAGNFDTPVLSPAPSLHLLRDENHLSCMELPIVQSV
jgi:putative CocE/NonD family hydrolase